ncbi:MAG: hypothetical protein M3Z01_06800 [Thermoproteota archaeon]|nr:hypothetical protein [Thermoproteota archaeon]
MELKTTVTLMVMVVAALAMIVAPAIIGSDDAFAKKGHGKSCNPHGCKGTHGYYTEKGHHHCYKGSSGCYSKGHH